MKFAILSPMVELLLCALLSAGTVEKLAVMDLEPRGVDKTLLENVNTLVAGALRKSKRFDVLTRTDIEKLLKFEESKQMAGQSANSIAIASMGDSLGFAKVLHGSLGRIGVQYVLSLSLMDTKAAHVLASETVTGKEDALVAAVDHAIRGLFEQLDKKN